MKVEDEVREQSKRINMLSRRLKELIQLVSVNITGVLTVKQTAVLLDVSESQVYKLIWGKKIKATKPDESNRWYINLQYLVKNYLSANPNIEEDDMG